MSEKKVAKGETALEKFRAADWKRIQLELTLYAVYKVQRLNWKTSEGLPRGLLPQDLALGAIQKTLEGLMTDETGKGIRRWNPEKEPELLEFLKSVVDSDVSSLVNLEEHALTNYCPDVTPEDAAKLLQASIDESAESASSSLSREPEDLIDAQEAASETETLYIAVMRELRVACRKDADELKVLDALEKLAEEDEDEFKTSMIARIAGLSDDRVRNAKRRIERRTRLIRERVLSQMSKAAASPPNSDRRSERSVRQ